MKNRRHEAILRIIAENDIETQHDLIASLKANGFSATQATISRDVRDLGIIKTTNRSGKPCYSAASANEPKNYAVKLLTIFRESVTSYAQARNIVVIKTLPGLASAASSAIDGMGVTGLVGTVAGDDTAFLAMTDDREAERFCLEIANILS